MVKYLIVFKKDISIYIYIIYIYKSYILCSFCPWSLSRYYYTQLTWRVALNGSQAAPSWFQVLRWHGSLLERPGFGGGKARKVHLTKGFEPTWGSWKRAPQLFRVIFLGIIHAQLNGDYNEALIKRVVFVAHLRFMKIWKCIYLEAKLPLFWLEKALFWRVDLQK